jgi:hypothetical protein
MPHVHLWSQLPGFLTHVDPRISCGIVGSWRAARSPSSVQASGPPNVSSTTTRASVRLCIPSLLMAAALRELPGVSPAAASPTAASGAPGALSPTSPWRGLQSAHTVHPGTQSTPQGRESPHSLMGMVGHEGVPRLPAVHGVTGMARFFRRSEDISAHKPHQYRHDAYHDADPVVVLGCAPL